MTDATDTTDTIEASPEMTKLLDETFGREGLSGWQKSVYKGTDCGAWLEVIDENEIRMGSIVEGADECAETHTLTMPFTEQEVWNALEAIEKDCDRIWKETHGCDDCWPEGCAGEFEFYEERPFGGWAINPNCKSCDGDGIVI